MQKKLTNAVFEQVCQRGYAIVEGLLPAEQVAQMAVAARRLLKPWHEVKKDPPKDRLSSSYFPYPEQVLNEAIVHREAIAFAQRYLGTQAIHYRPGLLMCTYPGRGGMDFHLDNGNNSLLPPTSERRHAQLNFWFYLEDVEADQAPTLFVANEYERDPAKAEAFVAPAGSVAIFDNYSWHAASPYKRQDGQRYVWKFAYGRADHYWEGRRALYTGGQQRAFPSIYLWAQRARSRTLPLSARWKPLLHARNVRRFRRPLSRLECARRIRAFRI